MKDSATHDRDSAMIDKPRSSRSGSRRIAANVASMLTTNIVHKATMFVIYVLVARFLGAHQFGQLTLAVVLLHTWHLFALLGMQTFLTREVARNPEMAGTYTLHASVIGLLSSFVGMILLVPFLMAMGYSADTSRVIYILFIGLTPMVLSQVCEGVFQGGERMDLVGYVNVPLSVLRILAVIFSIKWSYGIQGVAISLTALQFAVMILQWFVIVGWIGMPRLEFDKNMAKTIIRSSSTFLGIHATIAIQSSATVTILSKIGGETSVGIFAAASQLLAPFSLLFSNVAIALFPAMCRGYDESVSRLSKVVHRVIGGLMIIALPSVLGLFLLADPIFKLLYGDMGFSQSAQVLRIIVWSLLFFVLTSIMGQALWASSREKLSLRISLINMFVQVISGILLIGGFGVIGAAASVLITSFINMVQHLIPTAKFFSDVGWFSAIKKPAIASTAMTALVLQGSDQHLLVTIGGAAGIYSLVLVGLFVWSAGGISQFRSACANLWTT